MHHHYWTGISHEERIQAAKDIGNIWSLSMVTGEVVNVERKVEF